MIKFTLEKFVVEVIDNPAETLTKKEQHKLIQQAIPVTRKAFGNEGVTESDVITHAIEVSTAVYIKNTKDELLAFSTCVPETVRGMTIIHLKGSAIHPDIQGKGLYSILIPLRVLFEAQKHEGKDLLVGTRTQNPRVYEKTIKLGLYPRIDEPTPDYLKPIARDYAEIMRDKHSDFKSNQGLEFDDDRLVIKRTYGYVNQNGEEITFCMYGDNVPVAKDKRINEFLNKELNYKNGDVILLLGPYSKEKSLSMVKEYKGNVNEIINRFS